MEPNAIFINKQNDKFLQDKLEQIYAKTQKFTKNKLKNISCIGIKRLTVMKINAPPKIIYKFNTISIKISIDVFLLELNHWLQSSVENSKQKWPA